MFVRFESAKLDIFLKLLYSPGLLFKVFINFAQNNFRLRFGGHHNLYD